jgi:hypothetical protein
MFDISGSNLSTVNIASPITPSLIYVISPINYEFGGQGKITGNSRLIKSLRGALTLKGDHDYNGATKVEQGELYIDGTLANTPVTVYYDAALGGNGTIATSVVFNKYARIAPGRRGSAGKFSFAVAPDLNKTVLEWEKGDTLAIAGDLNLTDRMTLHVKTRALGEYPVVAYTGAFGGTVGQIDVKSDFNDCTFTLKDSLNTIWIAVNSLEDATLAGGGTEKNTTIFTPKPGKYYRIINYAVSANSSTGFTNSPRYMAVTEKDGIGVLGSTTGFAWNNRALLWEITPDASNASKFNIRNMESGKYFNNARTDLQGNAVNSNGSGNILLVDNPLPYSFTFALNEKPAQANVADSISFFRINNAAGKQIRAVSFANQWSWDNGTLNRADMVFTFVSVDKTLFSGMAIDNPAVTGNDPLISIKYYNLQGINVLKPYGDGIFIVKYLYQSGKVKTKKIISTVKRPQI